MGRDAPEDGAGVADIVVETPAGCRNKYEHDERTGTIRLDRRLPSSTVYPADYGFVPDTLGLDGDALDVLVLVEDPTFPGCTIRVRVIGLFRMEDEHGPDAKLITVPENDARWDGAMALEDIPESVLREIAHFFEVYKDLEPDRTARVIGFGSRAEALAELERARRRRAGHPGPG